MRRRWAIAFIASIAAHVALVAGLVASRFRIPPIEIEITSTRLDKIRDLPLGPPPSAPTHQTASRPAPTRRRAPQPPAHDGQLARQSPAPVDKPGPVDDPDAGPAPPPSADGLHGYGPEGSRVTALLRLDRLRGTPYMLALDALLASSTDRRDLLDGTGLDLFRDLDALLVATPDPRDETATFLAGRHRLTDAELRAALDQGARATGRVLTWHTEDDRSFAERHAGPIDPVAAVLSPRTANATRDDRLIVLAAPGLVVVTPPIYRPLLMAHAPAGATTDGGRDADPADAGGNTDGGGADAGGGERWAVLLRRIDAEDGAMPPDAVALLTAIDIFAAPHGPATTFAGLPRPRILTATIGITPTPWLEVRAELETQAQARVWERTWPVLQQYVSATPFMLMTGLGRLLAHTEIERVDSQIHLRETVTQTEAMRILQFATRILRTTNVAVP